MNKGFSTPSLPIYSAGGMQSVLELTLALKVAPDTAVVKKKTFKADTNSLQAHIRDELYDTAEPNNIKLPAPF